MGSGGKNGGKKCATDGSEDASSIKRPDTRIQQPILSYPSKGARSADRPMMIEMNRLSMGFQRMSMRIVRKK